jgi:hypothetical protein
VGQKIHPLGFRLGISKKHSAQWFAKPNQYSGLVDQESVNLLINLNTELIRFLNLA